MYTLFIHRYISTIYIHHKYLCTQIYIYLYIHHKYHSIYHYALHHLYPLHYLYSLHHLYSLYHLYSIPLLYPLRHLFTLHAFIHSSFTAISYSHWHPYSSRHLYNFHRIPTIFIILTVSTIYPLQSTPLIFNNAS